MTGNQQLTRNPLSRFAGLMFGGRNSHGLRTRGLWAARRKRRRSRLRSLTHGFLGFFVIVFGVLAVRLAAGPIALDMMNAPLSAALEDRVGHGYHFAIGSTYLEKGKFGPALTLRDVSIRDPGGRLVVAAPEALVELNPFALAIGDLRPTRFELVDVGVRVAVLANGQLAVSAGPTSMTAAAQPVPAPVAPLPAAASPLAGSEAPLRDFTRALAAGLNVATASDGPIGALVRVGIAGGTLDVDDTTTGVKTTFKGFNLEFDREKDGATHLTVHAEGPRGPWSGKATVTDAGNGARTLDVRFSDLSLGDIMLATGVRHLPVETDMPLSLAIRTTLGADGNLQAAEGTFSLGAGHLRFDDPDDLPRLIDEIGGKFHLDPATGDVNIDQIAFFEQQTEFHFTGSIKPPHSVAAAWVVALTGNGVLGPMRRGEPPVVIDRADIAMHGSAASQRVDLDRVALHGPSVNISMKGVAAAGAAGPSLKLLIINDVPNAIRSLFPLWPVSIAHNLRRWTIDHINDGILQKGILALDLDAAGLDASRHDLPIPRDSLSFDFDFTGMNVALIEGAPPVAGLAGHAHVTGRTARFDNLSGAVNVLPGHALTLAAMTFDIPDTAQKPAPASVAGRLQGGADTLLDLLAGSALKPYIDLPANLVAIKGQVDAKLGVDLKLGPNVKEPPAIRAEGQVNGFVIDKALGSEKIEGDALLVAVDKDGIRAKGAARILGAPATIDLRKAPGAAAEAALTLTIDDAFRAKHGLSLNSSLTGPVQARINATLGQAGPLKAQVELDLTRLGVNKWVPGLVKAAGKPGKATFGITQHQDGFSIDNLAADSGSISVRGNAAFSNNGDFTAKLSQLRMSAIDDITIDAAKSANVIKLAVRAKTLDARPFLREIASLSGPSGPAGPEINLDMKSQSVRGFNDEKLTDADLKLVRSGSKIRQFRFSCQSERGRTLATLGGADGATMTIATNDAGSTLSFLDLYRHMEGGGLSATIRIGVGQQNGAVFIRDFVLRNEPALSQIAIEAAPQAGIGDRKGSGPSSVDTSTMRFKRLQARFVHAGGNLILSDAAASGRDMGATVAGSIDFGNDKLDLHGAFVPAYSVNNLFARIPLFGPLLGGGTHEGMFAINYRVSGKVSAPNLLVNPLSAVTPGIFRQIFGAIDGTAPAPDATQPPAASTEPQNGDE